MKGAQNNRLDSLRFLFDRVDSETKVRRYMSEKNSPRRIIQLEEWDEIRVPFQSIEADRYLTRVLINGDLGLILITGTQEASILNNILKENLKGKKIGILKTDIPTKPLLARLVSEASNFPDFYPNQLA